ncbi:AraC family transcriptional regulator [Flavobacterium sp.]|uniref:AraC family transcriptional regulator n=1 Tax=Flavobacterium sp. TaxID=239 RepID=UPI003753065E
MKQKKYLIAIFINLCIHVSGQYKSATTKDSLQQKEFSYLSKEISYNKKDTSKSKIYAESWLKKSRTEKNWKQMALAYREVLYFSNKKQQLKKTDSLIIIAKLSKDNAVIGKAYLTKGIIYYDRKELQKALDNYILADQYLSQTKDEYAIYKVKYSIAHSKYYLGFFDEAIALFKECIKYFEQENDRAYLNSIHSIGLCFNRIGKYDSCTYYNDLGLKLARELSNNEMNPYFIHSEGINLYFKKQYTVAISKLSEAIKAIDAKKDFANQTVAFFYIGKSYLALKQENKAISFFKKVDKAFVDQKYIRPDLRENYELLIKHYERTNKPNLQLEYINKLLKVDKLINENYKYLSQKIFKEYDTKKLLQTKANLEKSLNFNNKINYSLIALLLIAITVLTHIHNRNKRKYRERFEELIKFTSKNTALNDNKLNLQLEENHNSKLSKEQNNNELKHVLGEENVNNTGDTLENDKVFSESDLELNPTLVASILQNLEKFEKNKKYLEKDMNLIKLAALLKTNTKYASKIVYKHRNKKIIEYISDLKIYYIVDLLKAEKKYRNYTNKALGEEAGFGSTQNFTKAFKNRTRISPTYFIRELNKKFPL